MGTLSNSTTNKVDLGWRINGLNILIWLVFSMIFTIVQIQQSLHQGQLSLPPSYDDVSYFNDALSRLDIFYNQGFRGLAKNYISNPPHSLMSTLLAFVGFAIFGIQDWAPSFMNFIIVFISLIFLDYSTRRLKLVWTILIAISSLTWLLMGHAIIEFRPDIFCGVLTAMSVILITEKSWFSISENRQKIIGVLCGLALITKPTVFPVTVILVLSALLLNFFVDKIIFGFQYDLKTLFVKSRYFLISSISISSFYFLFGLRHVLDYIYENQFVNLQKVWKMHPLPFLERISFYLTGQGGMMMTKYWLYLWLILFVVSVVIVSLEKKWSDFIRLTALILTIALSFLIVTISDHKSPFLGVILSCFFFLTSIQMLGFILELTQSFNIFTRRFFIGCILVFLTISIVLFEWPAPNDLVSPNPGTLAERRYYNNLLAEVVRNIVADNEINTKKSSSPLKSTISLPPKLYLSSMAHWLHTDSIKYYQHKLGVTGFNINDGVLVDDLKKQINEINESNYILAFSTPSPDTPDWLPSVSIEKKVIDFLNKSPNFQLIKTYTNPYTKAQVYLYEKEKN